LAWLVDSQAEPLEFPFDVTEPVTFGRFRTCPTKEVTDIHIGLHDKPDVTKSWMVEQ
jgi:hypothetical protein